MSTEVVTKIRIVKCPRCRNLLPEPQGYDVYKCGGCGTDLKAKKQSMAVNSDSSIQEINAAPGSTSDLVSEGKQRSRRKHQVPLRKDSLKAKATASSRECYLDGNGEDSGGQLIPFKFTDDEDMEGELDIPKLSLRRRRVSNKGGSNKITHCEIEQISDNGDFSLERPKDELIYSSDDDGNDDRSALIGDRPEMEITESNLQGNFSLEGANEELISGSDEEDANKEKSVIAGANPEVEIIGSGLERAEDLNNDNLPLEELNSGIDGEDVSNDKSAIIGENLEGEITGNNIAGAKLNNEKWPLEGAAIEGTKSEIDTAEGTATKNLRTENVTLDTRDHSSELSAVLGKDKLSKSTSTRSSYAYDDGLSSHNGMNEHFPVKHLDSLKNTDTVDEGRNKKGKGLANSSLYGDLGTQHQSHMPHDQNHDMKESRRNQIKVLDNTRHGNSRLMKTKRDHEFPARIPFQRSGYQSRNESGRPRNGMHDQGSSFLLPDSRADTDQEKMKLLRMIHMLQDQLDKTHVSEETNRRLSKGVSYRGNHSHGLHEGRFSHALDHARCNGSCNHGIMPHQRHKYSRIPYSAEVTSCAHRVHHSCYHCCSHVSADSSPCVHFQHDNLYRSSQGQDCCSSSPQHFIASKLPLYASETNSDDQRYRATAVRKYIREKQNLAKRHHRPIAGGAPFITCHKCSKLLQLPADFLLYKRVCHKLKCGDCSEVLKFSLKNGSHVVPFSSNTIGLPSRELQHQSEVISSNNLPSKTRVNYYHYSPAKPISYYDDYGLSVSQSFSSEVDPVFHTQQFHSLNGAEYVNPNVSPSSTVKAKIVASRYFGAIAASMETNESAEFTSNMSETRKLSAEKEARLSLKNTLYNLMGYSTPSHVIRGNPY